MNTLNNDKVSAIADVVDTDKGDKGKILPAITPFVSRAISGASPEDMRLDTERQFREIASVTEDLLLAIQALENKVRNM